MFFIFVILSTQPSTPSFLLIYACVGKKNKNLHLRYIPEMPGVTCVFQKPFPFFFRQSIA